MSASYSSTKCSRSEPKLSCAGRIGFTSSAPLPDPAGTSCPVGGERNKMRRFTSVGLEGAAGGKETNRKLGRHLGVEQAAAFTLGAGAERDQARMQRLQLVERFLQTKRCSTINENDVNELNLGNAEQKLSVLERLEISRHRGLAYTYYYLRFALQRSGLKHVALVALLAGYTMLGGLMFMKVEAGDEIAHLKQSTLQAVAVLEKHRIILASLLNVTEVDSEAMLLAFYKEMEDTGAAESVMLQGIRNLTALRRRVIRHDNFKWTFAHAAFYAMTVYTTIGYGTVAAATNLGKTLTVLYAVIGIPMMLVVVNDVGNVLFLALQKLYNMAINLWRRQRVADASGKENSREVVQFPIWLALVLFYCYLMLVAVIVYQFDEVAGPSDIHGLDIGNCFYFAFISITTIGLGDIMPINIQYSPVVAGLFLFGLALLGVINSASQSGIQRNYFRAVSALEAVLHQREDERIQKHSIEKHRRAAKFKCSKRSKSQSMSPFKKSISKPAPLPGRKTKTLDDVVVNHGDDPQSDCDTESPSAHDSAQTSVTCAMAENPSPSTAEAQLQMHISFENNDKDPR